jgi:hypothetical protein
VYGYTESLTDAPGAPFGRNLAAGSAGERSTFVYDGSRVARTEFARTSGVPGLASTARGVLETIAFSTVDRREGPAGPGDDDIVRAVDVQATPQAPSVFRHDRAGRVVEDNRFRYEHDHRGRRTRVTDTYTFGRNYEMFAEYRYDHADRLVLVTYGPRAARADFQAVFPDRRIVYDGRLPHAEMDVDASGRPLRLEARYATHPDGTDVGAIQVRTHFDIAGAGTSLVTVEPVFDVHGALTHVHDPVAGRWARTGMLLDSSVRSGTRRRHVAVPPPAPPETREDLVALRPAQERREIALTSLSSRWDPFAEAAMDVATGRVAFDPTRNFELARQTAQQALADHMSETIQEGQRRGLQAMGAVMGAVFLPIGFIQYPLATAGALALDVAIDYAIVRGVMREQYTPAHFLESMLFSGFYLAGPEPVARHGARLLRKTSVADGPARRLARAAAEEGEDVWHRFGDRVPDSIVEWRTRGGERLVKAWENAPRLRDRLNARVLDVIADAADSGSVLAARFLDDVTEGRVMFHWAPDLDSLGGYSSRAGLADVLLVNPFVKGEATPRSVHEIAGTILHEYVHFKGYNETRAFFEEFTFYWHMVTRSRGAIGRSHLPEVWEDLVQFGATLRVEGPDAARRWVFDLLTTSRHRAAAYATTDALQFLRKFSSFWDGHYQLIEVNLVSGGIFDPYEAGRFLELTAR